MPAPLAKGLIIAASVLVAAGIAAYESPELREWIQKSRQKIAVALRSLGDDSHHQRPTRDDPSMREDAGEKAEEMRRLAREHIMERGRMLEEKRRRQQTSAESTGSSEALDEKRSPSFDTLVEEDGTLKPDVASNTAAAASGTDYSETNGQLRQRGHEGLVQPIALHESVDAPLPLRHLHDPAVDTTQAWESRYEQEMRTNWNITLPPPSVGEASAHPSESLIDLTPTTEDAPDPDFSIPSTSDFGPSRDRAEYFSVPASRTSRTLSEASFEHDFYYAHPDQPMRPLEARPVSETFDRSRTAPRSSTGSVAGSATHLHPGEVESEDDFSELGDGIKTPASAWTEVSSTVSAEDLATR